MNAEADTVDSLVAEAVAAGAISPAEAEAIKKPDVSQEESETDLRHSIGAMTVAQKLKLSLFGGLTARSILIFDPNKLIQAGVLKNARLTQPEVETFLKSPTISEFVIRTVASSREWMRHYAHKLLVVTNPKTPQDVSLKWLRYVTNADLKRLAKSKNIPSIVSSTAARMVAATEKKQ